MGTVPFFPIADSGGRRKNLRLALYRRDGKLALHVVNYNVCLLDPKKQILDVEPTELKLPVPKGWTAATATCFDPDAEPKEIPCRLSEGAAVLTVPKTHVYQVVVLTSARELNPR